MRSYLLALGLTLALFGCANEEELRPAREPESTFSMAPPPAAYQQPQATQPVTDAPTAPPRLSHTVTLGESDYSPTAPPPPANGQGGVNVTVNNNIMTGPSGYGGYGYGGYGYGGGYGGYGRSSIGGGSAFRGSGWEGAQRTAAPGHTPAVGGNWSPPPSYGPRQMK